MDSNSHCLWYTYMDFYFLFLFFNKFLSKHFKFFSYNETRNVKFCFHFLCYEFVVVEEEENLRCFKYDFNGLVGGFKNS